MGLMLVLSLGLLLKGWIDDEVDRRARRAFEQRAEKLVIAAFPEWPAARVTGVQTVLFGGVGPVCGWVDDGRNATLPFRVDPPLDDYPDVALIIAKPHVGSPEERAQQAFAKQLILRLCEIDRDFTSPPNAARPRCRSASVDIVGNAGTGLGRRSGKGRRRVPRDRPPPRRRQHPVAGGRERKRSPVMDRDDWIGPVDRGQRAVGEGKCRNGRLL